MEATPNPNPAITARYAIVAQNTGVRRVPAGEWGVLPSGERSPSFFVEEHASSDAGRLFVVLRNDNAKFREEFPGCRGVPILSRGSSSHIPKGLVTVLKPVSGECLSQGWKRGGERRVTEALDLTDAGKRCLANPKGKLSANTKAWGLRYACGGVNTFRVVASVPVLMHTEPEDTADVCSQQQNLQLGAILVAHTIKHVGSRVWVQLAGLKSWVAMTSSDGVVLLQATGCHRQCGGVSMCSPNCTMQSKTRHYCNFQVQFYATVQQITTGQNFVRVMGTHSPHMEQWSALPISHRPVSPRTRDAIISGMGMKETAKQTMLRLDIAARQRGAETNGRGVCEDRSLVPSMRKIQEIQTNVKRSGRHQPAFELIDARLRGVMKPFQRVIYYRQPDPSAAHGSMRSVWMVVIADEGCLANGAQFQHNGQGEDGKHKLCEDDLVLHASSTFRVLDSSTHPDIPEFRGGFRFHDRRLAFMTLTNTENRWAIKEGHASFRRCMPQHSCTNPNCSHKLICVDFADGSGYFLRRECDGSTLAPWNPVGMIDHHDASAIALDMLGMCYVMCDFHSPKAWLDQFSDKLCITASSDLWSLMDAMRSLQRCDSEERLLEGLQILEQQVLPKMSLSVETQVAIIKYLKEHWFTPRWRLRWNDAGRKIYNCETMVNTNNHKEKFWQEVQKMMCYRMLKRPDELLERLSGLGPLGLSFYPSVLQSEALQARDRDDPRYRPRIPQDVTQRHMLANIILMTDEAVTELITGEVYAVKARVAPASLLKTEHATERTLNENDSTETSERLCRPGRLWRRHNELAFG